MLLYSTTLHMGVRTLPKVLTRQRPGRESNLVSAIHKSDALPVSHRATKDRCICTANSGAVYNMLLCFISLIITSMGRVFSSVCLSVCLQHNSKTNDPKVFKLVTGNEIKMS